MGKIRTGRTAAVLIQGGNKMDLFDYEVEDKERKARREYNTMLGEGILEETAGILLAEKYGETLARKIVTELRGWD